MGRRDRFAGAVAFSVASLVGGATAAIAVTGSVGDCGVHSGYHFYDQSEALGLSGVHDFSDVNTYVGSGNAPTGYIGSQGQLLRQSTGAVVAQAPTMEFNTGAAHARLSYADWAPSMGAGYYQGKGKSAAWNSSSGTYSYYGAITTTAVYMSSS